MASTGVGDVDVGVRITGVPATVDPNTVVSGTIEFSNVGTLDAAGMSYQVMISDNTVSLDDLAFTSLPPGVSVSFDPIGGVVTLSGMPTILTQGMVLSLPFTYTGPITESATIPVTASISTTDADANPDNDSDAASTDITFGSAASLDLTLTATCVQDAPDIQYDAPPVGFTLTTLATVELVGARVRRPR